MIWVRVLIALGGLAVAGYLVGSQGFDEVFHALRVAGWAGLVSMSLFHVVPTVLCAAAWRLLLRAFTPARLATFTWVRWVRDGLDSIVPILPVSGELIGIRLLALRGVAFADAGTVVDLTAELLGQVIFAVIGLALLIGTHPDAPHQLWVIGGVGLMLLMFVGFYIAQRKGLFRLIEHPIEWIRRRRRQRQLTSEAESGPASRADSGQESEANRPLHERILLVYAHHRAFAGSVALHVAAWLVSGVEAWIGLWFMGHPLGILEVVALEGLIYAIRSMTFFVPLGAGVQEGGYVFIGGLLGLSPDLALAVSLLKRGRDLCIGLPALLLWQMIEAFRVGRSSVPAQESD